MYLNCSMCLEHLGRSMGRGNPHRSRVGVCTGTGTGCHTAHPVPRPVQTQTGAWIFPWVHCDTPHMHCTCCTGQRWPSMYSFMSAFTYTHAHRQTFSFTHTDWQVPRMEQQWQHEVCPHLVVHTCSPTSCHNDNDNDGHHLYHNHDHGHPATQTTTTTQRQQ